MARRSQADARALAFAEVGGCSEQLSRRSIDRRCEEYGTGNARGVQIWGPSETGHNRAGQALHHR